MQRFTAFSNQIKHLLLVNTSTKQTLVKNSFWLALIEIVSKVLLFIITISIVRYLGASEFGRYNYALSFVGIAMIISDLGVSTILTREIAKNKALASRYLADATVVKGVTAVVIMFALVIILPLFDATREDPALFLLTGLYLLAQGMINIYTSVLAALERMEHLFIIRVAQYGLMFSSAFLVIFLHLQLDQLMLLYTLSATLAMGISAVLVKSQGVALIEKPTMPSLIMMLKEALPIFGMLAITQVYANLDTVLIRQFFGNEEVGLYHAGYKILFALQAITFISTATSPRISAFWHTGEMEKLRKLARVVLQWSILGLTPIVLLFLFGSNAIVTTIYGSQYHASAPALTFLGLAGVLMYFRYFFGNFFVASGNQKTLFFIYALGLVVNVSLNLLFLYQYGFVFAAFSLCVSEICMVTLSGNKLRKILQQ
ncbi:MAG: Polysaccharide biosynthesis protein [Microgenomates group bacterium GW2011_GWF2_45_18]|nr:MAG: Polysaccharide biosynthesis protein [Microgenomates group bacterium GW2011_GWF1_44_10]KKU01510.1 MAG: Polysaccharide biosynthesis protein [Microgenomates group bacterium GW2011_GWF2_45_18]HAX01576.1 hypothetical protein [Candidatus Paceibacterota bacterium]